MPPSEPPRSSRPKRRRRQAVSPTPAAAEQARAKAVRGGPKVKPVPVRPRSQVIPRPPRQQAPTQQQIRNAQAQRAQIVSSNRASAAAAYRAKPLSARRKIIAKAHATPVAQRTPEQKAAMAVHHGRHSYDKLATDVLGYLPRVHARSQYDQMVGHLDQASQVAHAALAADNAAAKVRAKAKENKPLKVGGINLQVKPAKFLKGALKGFGIGTGASAGGAYSAAKAATATPPGLKEAPAETAFKQTQRGAYAVKNVINEDIKRRGVKGFLFSLDPPHKASKEETRVMRQKAKRGFQLKEKTSGADILKTAGVKNKYVRAAGGVAIDFAAEGATTPGFGVGSVGARAAARAGRSAERAALKAGAEKEAARMAGQRAARRVVTPAQAEQAARSRAMSGAAGPLTKAQAKTARKAVRRATTRAKREAAGQGVAVRYVGHEIPGSRRATAAVGRGVRKVTKAGPAKTRAERQAAHGTEHAIRTARVEKQAAHAEANRVAAAAHASLRTDAERAAVAHALDTGKISDLTPSWRKVLKAAKGNKAEAQKIMEKQHPDEVRLARAATRLRATTTGVHVAERQANVAERTHPENFLTKGDKEKLASSAAKQQRRTGEAVRRAQTAAREPNLETRRAIRDRLKVQLRDELRKPVTSRRGVATLQANLDRANADLAAARQRASTRMQTPLEGRAGQAADRRTAGVQAQKARHQAAQNLPQQGRGPGVPITETHAAWLQRVRDHAVKYDLPLVRKRVDKLLAKKPKDVAQGYFPRVTEEQARKQLGIAPPKAGTATARAGTPRQATTRAGGKARKDVRPLNVVQAERAAAEQVPLSEHPALVVGGRVRQGREAVAESNFAQNLAKLGRPVTHESQVKPGEELHYLGRTGGKEGRYGLHADTKVRKGKTPRQYVAMPAGVVERATQANAAVPKFDNRALRAFDKLTSGYKGIITRNPVFQLKNTIGDIHRLVFEVPAGGKARATAGALKSARTVRAIERFQEGGRAPSQKALKAKINLGPEGDVTAQQLAARLRRHGMIDAGRSMQEQFERELLTPGGVKEGNVLRGNGRSVRGAVGTAMESRVLTQDAPNTIRASVWIAGKRMGLSDGDAADLAHKFFVDYGKLTPGERQVGRRILPFYTWTRQALPATLKNFAAHPARYGNMESVRNEWNQMITGLSQDELDARMSKFARRQMPFIIPVGHDAKGNPQFKAVSASFAVTLLNNLPTSLSATDLARGAGESGQTVAGMLNPLIRTPLELTSLMGGRGGHRLATDQPIEDPFNPTKPTPVPEWVKHLPKSFRDELKVAPIEDPKTGKKVLGWRGKADYGYAQLPSVARKAIEAAYAIEQGGVHKPYETRPGLTAILGGFGITADEVSAEVKKANARFAKVKRLGELHKEQQFLPAGVGKDHPTPQYLRIRAQINKLEKELRRNRPKKPSLLPDLGGGQTAPLLPSTSTGPSKGLLPGS